MSSPSIRGAAQRYGSVAQAYRRFWAPVMVAHSRPMLGALPLERSDTIADLGCGVGVIGARLAKRARTVVGIDVAEGMLRRVPDPVHRVAGDIATTPFGDDTLDGAISTFALQHVARTGRAFKEAARALRSGGFLGTATWGTDHAEEGGCYAVVDDMFARHRIPAETQAFKTWHDHVDEPAKLERYARGARLTVERSWAARSTYEWPRKSFFGWVTTMGPYGRRLMTAPEAVRAHLVEDLTTELSMLPDAAFRWTPECVYVIAIKL
ncbi:MAG TPA: class I SAM-dependent methyltransferase [Actinomycetota bacterium]|nr:class I SAM-dependent methyltransferase [Actinomycetota bacterium]